MSQVNPEYMKHYVNYKNLSVLERRSTLLWLLFIFCDLLMILPAFAPPFQSGYLYAIIPPVALFHLYAFWIALSPYKRQVDALLGLAVLGWLSSYGFLVIAHKMIYGIMGVTSPIVMIIVVSFMVLSWYIAYRWHYQRLAQGYYFYEGTRTPVKPVGNFSYLFIAFLAMMLFQAGLGYSTGNVGPAIGSSAMIGLSFISGMFNPLFQKYLLIRRNPDWYQCETPDTKNNKKRGANKR